MAIGSSAAVTFDAEACTRMTWLRRLQAGAHSGAWLTNLPVEKDACAIFSVAEWQALLRFRCGVPMQARSVCGGCASPLDPFGDHALACAACGMYARHNRLRDTLAEEFRSAGQSVQLEVQLPGGSPRPADILLLQPDEPTPAAVDVSVVHPLHLSSLRRRTPPDRSRLFERKRNKALLRLIVLGWVGGSVLCALRPQEHGVQERSAV